MRDFKNKAKSFMIGAALVPASMLAGGLVMQSGGLSDEEVRTNTFSLSHAMECAYSVNIPDEHKRFEYTTTNHGMESGDNSIPYAAHPLATYPAMLGLGLLAARGRWYDKLAEKCR